MFNIEESVLLVVDVQGKLASLMYDHERLFANLERMIRAAQLLELPILWTEQAPEKIGETVEPIKNLLFPVLKPIHKKSFSCYRCPEFLEHLKAINRRQIIVVGIETHVCVYQTVCDLRTHGYDVHLIADAVSSRTQDNKELAIARMRDEGATIATAEMTMCELLKTSEHPKFKAIMTNIKR